MKKFFILSTFILIFTSSIFAQKQSLKNIPYIDLRRFHYGFAIGIDCSDISFEHNGKEWFAECPNVNPAFCVGLLGDMAITEHLSLRCSPMLYFQSRGISLINQNTNDIVKQDLKSYNLEVPVSFKISTRRVNNYRPYILTGVSVSYDLAKDKEVPIVLNHVDYGIHIALGCDTYLPYFKFCPELRFNLGIPDIINHQRNNLKDSSLKQYSDAIEKARTKSISLIFFFE